MVFYVTIKRDLGYIIQRQNYSIRIAETVFNKADLAVRCSNLEEFFDVIDW